MHRVNKLLEVLVAGTVGFFQFVKGFIKCNFLFSGIATYSFNDAIYARAVLLIQMLSPLGSKWIITPTNSTLDIPMLINTVPLIPHFA
jgi:hypothetical protein